MQVLADNGGYVLAEDGARLVFFARRILPTWVAFVLGVLAAVAIGNGVIQLVLGNLLIGGLILALAAFAGLGLRSAVQARRRAKAVPLDPATAVCVIDLAAKTLLDGCGEAIAPLDAVRVERAMQATSSARSLRVVWPGGAAVVYRGDALQLRGSIEAPVEALRARGVPITG